MSEQDPENKQEAGRDETEQGGREESTAPETESVEQEGDGGKKRSLVRKVALALGCLLLLVLVLIALMPLWSPLLKPIVVSKIEARTGRAVSLRSMSASLFTSKVTLTDLTIKEEDETRDFAVLKRAHVDFSILPLLAGKVRVPTAEVEGVVLNVRVDEAGRANFQSILERLAAEKKPAPPAEPEKKPGKLPDVRAHVIFKDVNVSYVNRQNDVTANLRGVGFDCTVAGLQDIQYESDCEVIEFASMNEAGTSGSLVYELSGKLSLAMPNGKPRLGSEGSMLVSGINVNLPAGDPLQDRSVRWEHALNLDMSKGTFSMGKFSFVSDYLKAQVSELDVTGLDKIPEVAAVMRAGKDGQARREALRGMHPEGWRCDAEVVLDLGRIEKDFGKLIVKRSGGKLSNFGGKVLYRATMGQAEGNKLKASHRLALEDFFAAGTLERMQDGEVRTRPYAVALKEVSAAAEFIVDLQDFGFDFEQQWLVTAPANGAEPATLVRMHKSSAGDNLISAEGSPFRIEDQTANVLVDFTEIGNTFKDLMPPDTALTGRLTCEDRVSGEVGQGFVWKGNTDMRLDVQSPRAPDLKPLELTGERDLAFNLNHRMMPTMVHFRKMRLRSKNSGLVDLNMTGRIDVPARVFENVKFVLLSEMGDAQPYLNALAEGVRVRGTLRHEQTLSGSGEQIQMAGSGGLLGFDLTTPAGEPDGPPRQVSLKDVEWRQDLTVFLKDRKPVRVVIPDEPDRYFGLTHPMLRCRVKGVVDKIGQQPGKMTFEGFQITASGDLSEIPSFILERLRRRGRDLSARGTFSNVLSLNGDLAKLTIANAYRCDGHVELVVKLPHSGAAQRRLVLDQTATSDLKVVVEGLNTPPESRELTVRFAETDGPLLSLTRGGETMLLATLDGVVRQRPERLSVENLALNIRVNGAPLDGAIPADWIAAGDDGKQWLLTDGLTLGGHGSVSVSVDGSPQESLRLDVNAEFTPFSAVVKNREGELLVNKGDKVPLTYRTSVVMTRAAGGRDVKVDPLHARFADLSMKGELLLDAAHNLSGPGGEGGASLIVSRTELDSLHDVLPILKKMELKGAVVEFRLEDLAGNLKRKDVSGKLKLLLDAPYLSLPKLRAATAGLTRGPASRSPKEQATPTAHTAAPSPAAAEFVVLPESTRRQLRKSVVDIQVRAGMIKLDELNELQEFAAVVNLNRETANNKLSVDMDGKLNPDDESRAGRIDVALKGDLSQAHPPFELTYDLVKLPYMMRIVEPMAEAIRRRVPVPIFSKMSFGDPKTISFGAEGTDRWRGIDQRAMKKSLVSERTNKLYLPGGKFDVGFELAAFLDPEAIKKAVGKRLKPLTEDLKQLKEQKENLLERSKQAEAAVDKVKKTVDEIDEKKESARKLIQRLKPLAAFNPATKDKLEEAEKQLDRYDERVQEQKKLLTDKKKLLAKLQEETKDLRKKIADKQAGIEEAMKQTGGQLDIGSPFSFSFESATLSIDAVNPDPWQGTGGPGELGRHPTTKLEFVKFDFEPETKAIPTITGWADLEGRYRFQLMPSDAVMKDLEKSSPILYQLIRKHEGIAWTHEGFEPNPLARKNQ